MIRLGLFALSILSSTVIWAESAQVYIGTDSDKSQGIYHATLEIDSGVLSDAKIVAEIGSPEFLAMDDLKEYLYAVAIDDEPVVAAYRIVEDGGLVRLNAEPIGDGRGAHIAVHPSGKFLLTAQYFEGCTSSNKWNRRSDYLVESFVPHCHVTRRVAGSANDVSRWSFV